MLLVFLFFILFILLNHFHEFFICTGKLYNIFYLSFHLRWYHIILLSFHSHVYRFFYYFKRQVNSERDSSEIAISNVHRLFLYEKLTTFFLKKIIFHKSYLTSYIIFLPSTSLISTHTPWKKTFLIYIKKSWFKSAVKSLRETPNWSIIQFRRYYWSENVATWLAEGILGQNLKTRFLLPMRFTQESDIP